MNKCRIWIFILVIGVILFGGLVPFAAQFIFPFVFPNIPISGAEIWNQYVSIILGIVATILSIVSLKMCFSSEEQTHETNIRVQKALDDLDKAVDKVSDKQDLLYNTVTDTQRQSQRKSVSPQTWDNNSIDENKTI